MYLSRGVTRISLFPVCFSVFLDGLAKIIRQHDSFVCFPCVRNTSEVTHRDVVLDGIVDRQTKQFVEVRKIPSPLFSIKRAISRSDSEETVAHITTTNHTFRILEHNFHLALGFWSRPHSRNRPVK